MIEFENEEEQAQYDAWTKEEIYKAFVSAYRNAEAAQVEIKRLGIVVAGLEYDLKQVKDAENGV